MRGLEAIDWAALERGDGAPEILRGLVSQDARERAWALEGFWAGPLQLGARFPATLAAVPFLVQALEAPHADHAALLHLLANVALMHADTSGGRRFDLDALLRDEAFDGVWLARECWVAVARGCATYRRFLAKEWSVETRSRAARLLALFPSQGRPATGDLRRIAMNELEPPALRASAFIALGHFVRIDLVEGEGLLLSAATRIGAALAEPVPEERRALVWPLVGDDTALDSPEPWPWPALGHLVMVQRAETSGAHSRSEQALTEAQLEQLARGCRDADAEVRRRAVATAGALGAGARGLVPALIEAGPSRDVLLALGRVATFEQCAEWLKGVDDDEVGWTLRALLPASQAALREWLERRPEHPAGWSL